MEWKSAVSGRLAGGACAGHPASGGAAVAPRAVDPVQAAARLPGRPAHRACPGAGLCRRGHLQPPAGTMQTLLPPCGQSPCATTGCENECMAGAGLLAESVAFSDAVVECSGIGAWMEYCQVGKLGMLPGMNGL